MKNTAETLPWKFMVEGGQKTGRELSLGAVIPTGLYASITL